MHPPTTLRGIFPERKVVHRKNFIKENMRRIKLIQEESNHNHHVESEPKILNKTPIPKVSQSKTNVCLKVADSKGLTVKKPGIQKLEIKPLKAWDNNVEDEKIVHRGIQTESMTDSIHTIYSTGVIKYASNSVTHSPHRHKKDNRKKKNDQGYGDTNHVVLNDERLSPEPKLDYVKQNVHSVRSKCQSKKDSQTDPTKAPPTYKKGVVPKYIKQKKEGSSNDDVGDVDCPAGHVLLPEDERKETLRVLRESYADKIQELNSMPVRSDTLRMQRRKMELEEELKKIDEGIKVFQRPKVFVKINV
ncbi:PREDICTED: uncharacterized protein LOC108560192 [Nicrophorus vespilloides]|uniref:Uncharacterized protein LOC108560192 n=1 Tax=Nicrophorus vespilloides TaxID=110193 RepID=A0ABM1MEY3_NICVS|nr:PREDICTED: uncharacterized protein LOC108560192 [Nicrophorus vespilloides]